MAVANCNTTLNTKSNINNMKRKYNKEHKSWRNKVLHRDCDCCQICGKEGKFLNCHHLIPANFNRYTYDTNNGIILCAGCHTLARFSAHKNPLWFTKWMAKNRPQLYWLAMDRLRKLENDI